MLSISIRKHNFLSFPFILWMKHQKWCHIAKIPSFFYRLSPKAVCIQQSRQAYLMGLLSILRMPGGSFSNVCEEDAELHYFQRSNWSQTLVKHLLTAQAMCCIIQLQCQTGVLGQYTLDFPLQGKMVISALRARSYSPTWLNLCKQPLWVAFFFFYMCA